MDTKLNTTQSAQYMGITRQTLRRLSFDRLLPDGETAAGRPYWLKSTIDQFCLGTRPRFYTLAFYVQCLPGIDAGKLMLPQSFGSNAETVLIETTNTLEALSEVFGVISSRSPTMLVLPAIGIECQFAKAIIRACGESGIQVLMAPNKGPD